MNRSNTAGMYGLMDVNCSMEMGYVLPILIPYQRVRGIRYSGKGNV